MGVAMLLAGSGLGCGGGAIIKMDVRGGLSDWRGAQTALPTGTASTEASKLDVGVTTTRSFAVDVLAGNSLVDLPTDDAAQPKDMALGFIIRDGGEALREVLERHLRKTSPASNVRLARASEASASDVVVRVSAVRFLGGALSHTVGVTVEAKLRDGRTLVATGSPPPRSSAGHLAWEVPVVVGTAFVSFLWTAPVHRSINTGIDEERYVTAIEAACADLATQITAAHAASGTGAVTSLAATSSR